MLCSANTTGIFLPKSAVWKCLSIPFAPSSKASKLSYPTPNAIDNPTALHNEKRPPTQSHMVKTFSCAIPNDSIIGKFVDTAAKCLATSSSLADCKNQFLIVVALLKVSCVVNDLETITNKVVSGFRPLIDSITWSPSTLETKCKFK